ncbi:PREDICTED: uncharacterized protein LOC107165027 [Diuraphis noxia]|uniref:uncharacterized protein LOC107165027 n=1 Tax=Diuraphis noxia TaxID=143948 RepID=UPI00076398FC|nr:PREDICTED: uncharacterized protein LOC107165027 [Diuraphis noxia]
MGSKFNSKMKNNIANHGEHSTRYDTKTVIQTKNKHIFKKLSVRLDPPIIMSRLKKYARKLPETIEEPTFGLYKRYPKRRKIERNQEELIKSKYIGPFDLDYLTGNSINISRKLKFTKPVNQTLFSKLKPDIVLDFIKQSSVNKITKLLDLMYTESIKNYMLFNDLTRREQSKRIFIEFEKYLFELCYKKFCELWLQKTPKVSLLSSKQFRRFIQTLLKHIRCKTTICNMNLKKLILNNRGLTGFRKKPLLILCINIICSFFNTISRKCSRMIRMRYKKKANCKSYINNVHSIKLYHKGTTKRKDFLEIVDEYKQIINADRLSFNQVADIKHAYEGILEPGQCIDKADLEKCANENYDFNKFQDGTKINHTDTIISEDLNISNNDDFDFDDIDHTPPSLLKLLRNIPNPYINNYLYYDNILGHSLAKVGLSPNHFVPNSNSNNMATTEDKLRKGFINCLEQDKTVIVNEDMDISVDNFEGATKYSGAGGSSNHGFNDDKCTEHIPELVKEVQSHNSVILKDNKNYVETTKDNSKNGSIEAIEKEAHVKSTSSEDHNIENETPKHSLTVVKPFINCLVHKRTAIVNQDIVISTGDVQKTTVTKYLFQNKLLSHPKQLTSLAKRMLSIIIYSEINLHKINWKRYPRSTKVLLYQIIVYFKSFKKTLCDKLNFDRLSLRENNIYNRIDIEKLLKSIQVETCVLKKYFTFPEAGNYLIWPIGKMIVNNVISRKSPIMMILSMFVKDIITKFYEKVNEFLHKSGLRIVLNKESLFQSLSYTRIKKYGLNTKLHLKYEPSSVDNKETKELQVEPNINVQKDPLDTNNVDMFLVTSNTSTPNESNNIQIDNLDTRFSKFKSDIILELSNSINEINEIRPLDLYKHIDCLDENNPFDNAFIDDMINVGYVPTPRDKWF